MMDRRTFLTQTGLASAAIVATPMMGSIWQPADKFVSGRPPLGQRKFTSKAIEEVIATTKTLIKDPEIAWMFENCFPNTLDTTVEYGLLNGEPDTFVITGDIHAMWLRDSTAQIWPYLPYVNRDRDLSNLILGVINRQTKCIGIDPYANAFNKEATGSEWASDYTDMKPELHERKWEIDSLCYPVRLSYHYWKITGNTAFASAAWEKSMQRILSTFKEQQRKNAKGPYKFARTTPKATDTLSGSGYGNPVKPVGLICSSFRPSDDATILPFLIPSNYFAIVTLRQMAEMAEKIKTNISFASECKALAEEVEKALKQYSTAQHLTYGEILAFEVDGYGNHLFMDDANVPSLLGLPYLGCMDTNDQLYQNTRRFALSPDNPWYFKGKAGEGIGGPHVGEEMIWPMSIIMRAMTSDSKEEIANCLRILKNTHAGTGFMHETFHKDNASNFTRKWFAWANTLFGELIIKTTREHPDILKDVV